MSDIGRGIATAGVWIGVGIIGLNGGAWIIAVAAMALVATLIIWGSSF